MQFLRVSDVVNELSVARQDENRVEFLRYMILSKSVLRELKMKYINDFVRVYLPIDQATMTVRLPLDFERFRTISLIEDCFDQNGKCTEKVIPLTHNPYINITPVPTTPLSSCNVCKCEPTHPVCSELSNYTTLCEEVSVDPNASPPLTGTKQTVLRTCSNGDIVKEVTQPTQKFIVGDKQCDYAIEVEVSRNICSYTSDWKTFTSPTFSFPFVLTLVIDGVAQVSGTISTEGELNAYLIQLGWVVEESFLFSYTGESVYGATMTIIDDTGTKAMIIDGSCAPQNVLSFPYTINQYLVNAIIVGESPATVINNQAEQDAFFAGLGFTKVDDTHYTKASATDVYFYVSVTKDNLVCNYGIDFGEFPFGDYPYTISYTLNGADFNSPILTNDTEMLDWFASIGFTPGGIGLELVDSSNDFGDTFTQNISPPTPISTHKTCRGGSADYVINFAQTNCITPMISDGISYALTSDVLCNVTLKEGCSCIEESQANIATICDCCSSLLNCCQNGALTNWNNWGYVPSCLTNSPQPYNRLGTYSLDETNYLIYLDSVCATKVLLAYDSDGGCDGDYVFPNFMLEAFKAGLAWKHAQYNEEITPFRRRELKMNYNEELSKLSREYTDVIRMSDLISALKTLRTPY